MATQTHNLLSPAEHKILVGIGFLLLILMIGSISAKCIESYNYQVEQEQKFKRGNDGRSSAIDFSVYGTRNWAFWETVLLLQFVWIPLIIFNLWRREKFKFSNFLTAFCLSAINLFCYFCWIYGSYLGRIQNKSFELGDDKFHTYLMINSNFFEFSMFVGFIILFLFQSFILLRFALEKFQIK